MIDTLIVVKNNQYGLTRDAELLAGAMREAGVPVEIAGISDRGIVDRLLGRRSARRMIHIERVSRNWIGAAEENMLVPNQERFPRRQLGRLRRIDLVLAKTVEACAAFAGYGVPIEHLGFTSEDRFDPAVRKDWNRVLHLAGGARSRAPKTCLRCGSGTPNGPNSCWSRSGRTRSGKVADNVKLITGYVDNSSLRRLQNECGIHLCPSRSEGWGHNLVEGLSCGALVITTDGAPMERGTPGPEFGLLVSPEPLRAAAYGQTISSAWGRWATP